MTDQGFTPDSIDTSKPHPARMYDYYLGGQDNYEVDRAAAERMMALTPDVRISARANRAFLQRVVRSLAEAGVDQFIDVGTGIPTSPNTHEIARAINPGARVAYVDNDPIVSVYAGAKLTNAADTGFFLGDLRDPESVIEHAELRDLIDFDRPVALMLVSVMHFVDDDADPAGIIAALTGPLAPGSRLVISHATADFHSADISEEGAAIYRQATARLSLRSREQILPLFGEFEPEEPGLVQTPFWRPTGEVPAEQRSVASYAGVGVRN
ncbi:SAM-dependent methyltransferase [Streptomyces sp. ST2-7A]|uniref:SAM-dependent methyltransferase n=1 Tax=Streptomyces sp. ST2-7A TaxID=2907214 RepID=UPI001F3930EF|nr:SAM-dependent methyltransferase [Streptomyces sp. ST2-7A]MCE7079288.1 SAM-dependent methyltransferase [Streptomyces sp. ST2-7A]